MSVESNQVELPTALDSLRALTVPQLKTLAKSKKLTVGGTKPELIARIAKALEIDIPDDVVQAASNAGEKRKAKSKEKEKDGNAGKNVQSTPRPAATVLSAQSGEFSSGSKSQAPISEPPAKKTKLYSNTLVASTLAPVAPVVQSHGETPDLGMSAHPIVTSAPSAVIATPGLSPALMRSQHLSIGTVTPVRVLQPPLPVVQDRGRIAQLNRQPPKHRALVSVKGAVLPDAASPNPSSTGPIHGTSTVALSSDHPNVVSALPTVSLTTSREKPQSRVRVTLKALPVVTSAVPTPPTALAAEQPIRISVPNSARTFYNFLASSLVCRIFALLCTSSDDSHAGDYVVNGFVFGVHETLFSDAEKLAIAIRYWLRKFFERTSSEERFSGLMVLEDVGKVLE
ncbi:hypothetical protein HDU93_000435, partial [Gonapodya sp. JEL0774]